MKKLYVGIIAAICCVAFAVPALAEVKMGGMISAEQFYWDRSADRVNPQTKNIPQLRDDYSSVEFGMGQPWNRLNMQYISDDKKIGGMIEIRTGGQKSAGNSPAASAGVAGNQENNFTWEFAYIDWHINPSFYLRIGRQTQTFAITSPDQQMGHNHGHIVMANFGNVHGGTSRDGIRAYIKFNDNVRMEVQLLNPDSDGTTPEFATVPRPTAAQGGPGGFALEENVIPRIDLSLPIKFANVMLEPSFTWLKQEYDQVGPGSDDSYDIWGIALGGKVAFGPFSITGEITYGENLGLGGYVGGGYYGARGIYTPTNAVGTTRFEDTEVLSWWVQLQFDFGPFALQGLVGYQSEENDGDPAVARDGAEFDVARWAYGFQVPINIAKNFKMVPQIWFYDYDDDAVLGTNTVANRPFNTDLGEEWMIGLFWQLTF
jgi:hypothetical protein